MSAPKKIKKNFFPYPILFCLFLKCFNNDFNVFRDIDPLIKNKGRLQTFRDWPFDSKAPCNPKTMAQAGFYFIGNEQDHDLVECFICGKQLDGWEETDDPW